MREQVPTPELGLGEDAFLTIRPLNGNEMQEVTKVLLGNMTKKDTENMKLSAISFNEQQGKFTALSFALSVDGQAFTPEDVAKLPHAIIERAYSTLSEISGFMSPQQRLFKKRLEQMEKKVLETPKKTA
jgi:hypothetical protein